MMSAMVRIAHPFQMNGGRRRVLAILAGDDGMVLSVSKKNNHFFLEVPNMGKMTLMPELEATFYHYLKYLGVECRFARSK
jgi:hypothetical protein